MSDAAALGRSEEQPAEGKARRGGRHLSDGSGELFRFCILEIILDKDKDAEGNLSLCIFKILSSYGHPGGFCYETVCQKKMDAEYWRANPQSYASTVNYSGSAVYQKEKDL